eukprot:6609612-Pyramimonas_sp.AAC.1
MGTGVASALDWAASPTGTTCAAGGLSSDSLIWFVCYLKLCRRWPPPAPATSWAHRRSPRRLRRGR